MVKIDFTKFIRDRIWFGWQCTAIFTNPKNGKEYGNWARSCFPERWRVPVVKSEWERKTYYLKTDNPGCQVWGEVND